MNIIPDLGMEAFSADAQDYIITCFCDTDWFEDALRESFQSYAEDIAKESGVLCETRLLEECYDNGVISDSDFGKDEKGDICYDQESCPLSEDKLIEAFVDNQMEDIDDPVQRFRDKFGDKEFRLCIQENDLIDWDDVIDWVQYEDGRGPALASYDGCEEEQEYEDELYYTYRIN